MVLHRDDVPWEARKDGPPAPERACPAAIPRALGIGPSRHQAGREELEDGG